VQDAWLAARDSEADVGFDGDALNPTSVISTSTISSMNIWFLDAVTALNQMRAAQSRGSRLSHCGCGSEDRSLWRCGHYRAKPG